MGVMVDREAHCLPPATILDGGVVNWNRHTFSSDSGIRQLFLRCHCMGLVCNQPR